MNEKDYYAEITSYYMNDGDERSVAWEAKITKSRRVSLSALSSHQEEKLLRAEESYGEKIPDIGKSRKPFDGWVLKKAKSVVVIIFYEPRKTRVFEVFIRDWIEARYTSRKKSLTLSEVEALGNELFL